MMKYIYQDIHIALTDERFRLLHFCRLKLYRTHSLIMAILPFSKEFHGTAAGSPGSMSAVSGAVQAATWWRMRR